MAENLPVKSDYNLEWVIGAWAEATGLCGFDLKMLKRLYSLRRFRSYKEMVKGIVIHLKKTVDINVYLHVPLTLLKVKTENKYN